MPPLSQILRLTIIFFFFLPTPAFSPPYLLSYFTIRREGMKIVLIMERISAGRSYFFIFLTD